jgi:hypothetical protein
MVFEAFGRCSFFLFMAAVDVKVFAQVKMNQPVCCPRVNREIRYQANLIFLALVVSTDLSNAT